MKIPKEIIQQLDEMNMKGLYNWFITLEDEYDDFKKDWKRIRYGIEVMFPIYWLWKETKKIIEKPKNNNIYIDGITYKEDSYELEKEERRKLMVKAILNNLDEVDILEARG